MFVINFQIHSIVFFILISINVSCLTNAAIGKSNMLSTIDSIMPNTNDQPDPYIGTFKGQLNGQEYELIIRKTNSTKYEIYVNGLGPDFATLQNGILEGKSEGIDFSIQTSNGRLLLSMNNQNIEFTGESVDLNDVR
ncbi:MAG: hypothetical protein IPL31_04710 [Saprospiraceae bacterium]|nr:hypothetical protein [Saprospiraceae bacterium]